MTSSRRLAYLDGIRAVAALYVVLSHCSSTIVLKYHLTGWQELATSLFNRGQIAVCVFITLSGYCLMLPAHRDSYCGSFRATMRFYQKRIWRIVPPYYGAMLVSLLFIALVPEMNRLNHIAWDMTLPAFTTRSILLHLTLAHNLDGATIYSINFPFWSIAVEFQIYILFPLILLPLWRWKGNGMVVGVSLTTGYLVLLFTPFLRPACPHFVGLFALGMAAATWHFPGPSRARLPRVPFAAVVALALAGVAVTVLFELLPFPKLRRVGEQDLFTGLAAAAFFVYGTACIEEGTPSRLIDFLSSRVMAWMGSFSYSIYLLHAPVLTFLYLKVIDQNLPPLLQLAELILVAVPGTLLFAYIFYLLIERHFIPDPARKAGA